MTSAVMRYLLRGTLLTILMVLIVVRIAQRRKSHGLVVSPVTSECRLDPKDLVDRRIKLRLLSDGRVFVNNDPIPLSELRHSLHSIYKQRSTRLIFIQAEDDLSFEHVLSVIEIAATVKDLKIILVTPGVREDCDLLRTPSGAA